MIKKHIILIGMRGAGKTYFGKKFARSFKLPLLDLDTYIQAQENISITEMVHQHGWDYFRKKESQYLAEVLQNFPACLCVTGGGAVLSQENRELIKKSGWVIWIWAPLHNIINHLRKSKNNAHRPALTQKSFEKELEDTYKDREPVYASLADFKFLSNENYSDQIKMFKNFVEKSEK